MSTGPEPTRREIEDDYCADFGCECHTVPGKAVLTPFPLGYGPVHCCARCARVALLTVPTDRCDLCHQPVWGQGVLIGMSYVPRHVLCPT